jgi:sorting nexin-29
LYELIKEIWDKETMPRDWTMGVICPIHKKNDKLVCDNYRGIMLLNMAYKVFAQVLARRLAPVTESLLGEYQCGFRPQRSTMDSIFVVRQVLEKCYEFDVDIHQLYIDFRKAYDSIKRNELKETLKQLKIPGKLRRLVMMTVKETVGKVKFNGDLSNTFKIKRGLRQGYVLSPLLFNLVLERVMRQMPGKRGGIIFNRTTQWLGYADVGIIA